MYQLWTRKSVCEQFHTAHTFVCNCIVLAKVAVEIIDTLPCDQPFGYLAYICRLAMFAGRTQQQTNDAVNNLNQKIGCGVRLLVVNTPIHEEGPTNLIFACRSLEALCRLDDMHKSGELKTLLVDHAVLLLVDLDRFQIGRLDWQDFKRCAKFFRTW